MPKNVIKTAELYCKSGNMRWTTLCYREIGDQKEEDGTALE